MCFFVFRMYNLCLTIQYNSAPLLSDIITNEKEHYSHMLSIWLYTDVEI